MKSKNEHKAGVELDLELADHLTEETGKRPWIFHPLLIAEYFPEKNAEYNEGFYSKCNARTEAELHGDWSLYVLLHEKPFRLDALWEVHPSLTDAEYWKLLGKTYVSMEFPGQDPYLLDFFQSERRSRELLMDEAEQQFLDRLPDPIVVYRGYRGEDGKRGLSWTLSPTLASWFAHRLDGEPRVVRSVCEKSLVFAALLGRHEAEIVLDPTNLPIEEVQPPLREAWLQALWTRCCAGTSGGEREHGPFHWETVERNGLHLAAVIPDCDQIVVQAFGPLHDCRRTTDGADQEHGARAAEFARKLHRQGELPLTSDQMEKLTFACFHHDQGMTSADPTIGICWDADRMDLIRVGILPERKFFSHQISFDLLYRI